MKTRLIIGCGYLGHRAARRWLADGDRVYAVTRRADRATAWHSEGLQAIVADVLERESLVALPAAYTVLFAVGHDVTSGQTHQATHVDGLRNVLEALPTTIGRVIYISSTGVYGDARGEWLDEDSLCQPERASGQACLAAERLLESGHFSDRAVILRLAGLYGPGRIPRRDALRSGEAIDAPQHGYLNLIHVDDAVAAVLAAAEATLQLPRTYLISDGAPVQRSDYYAELARLIGAPPPRFKPPEQSTAGHARAAADKRISNARMLAELRVVLRYPSYREGLKAIAAGGGRRRDRRP